MSVKKLVSINWFDFVRVRLSSEVSVGPEDCAYEKMVLSHTDPVFGVVYTHARELVRDNTSRTKRQ